MEHIQALAEPLRLILEVQMWGYKQLRREELTRRLKRTSTRSTQTPGKASEHTELVEGKTYHVSPGYSANKSDESGQETKEIKEKENGPTHRKDEKK